ncbi:MAG: PAS domain S-box protein [Desulfobacula sp.]|uniref:PAS domain S-box protein n=1 Tax=Desulfobacula sp. TaxID=2593537 RepID=UPI0025C21028|nr:PAS domain S-box protein [Desulfobacula sp.]MCD4721008.1 PAS domain S-box protein [Desulfobacula sp.]
MFDNIVQASAFHAVVAPAIADLKIWLSEGISGLPPENKTVTAIIFLRIDDAYQKALLQNRESRMVAQKILIEQQNRLGNFVFNANLLFVLTIMVVFCIVYLLIRQYILQIRESKAQSKLHVSEAKYRRLMNNSKAIIYRQSLPDGQYEYVSPASINITGYTPDEFCNNPMHIRNVIHPDWTDYLEKQWNKLLKGKIPPFYEFQIIHKSGEIRWIHQQNILIYDEGGSIIATEGIINDQTIRKQAEEKLFENEKKFRSYVENSPFGIFIADEKGDYIDVNNAACEITGYSRDELLNKNLVGMIPLEDQSIVKKHFESVVKTGSASGSMHFLKKDKSKRIWSVDAVKLSDTRFLEFVIDITVHKKREEEKIKTQKIITDQKKLALVGQIAGKIAHDFNNILGIIMGNTELALLDCKDDKTKKTLELVFEQTLRGKNLTRNLVAFAKDQEPKQQFFSVNEKIELVLNLLKKDLEVIDVIKEDGHGVPYLLADPGMIEHALVNLIQNAIHAISLIEHPKIIIRTFHKDKNIYIEIEDNGCGISEDALDIIYEPAFTMKGSRDITGSYKPGIKGTGYGMANVKKYIEQHKGNIVISSNVGKGTKITISLPVIKKELTQKEVIEIKKKNFSFEKYILLVEDEQAISDVQYKILTHEPCNHKVDVAANGQMAIDLFDRNQYDFISLDYVLPGEINGMDVYKHIRQANKTVPILFVSGNLDFLESVKELKNKDSCVDHVSKPCQNKDYVNTINDLLAKT